MSTMPFSSSIISIFRWQALSCRSDLRIATPGNLAGDGGAPPVTGKGLQTSPTDDRLLIADSYPSDC